MTGFIVATAINAIIYGLQYYITLRQHYATKEFWDVVGGFCIFEVLIFIAWLWR